ncbi:MAG TPA: hypothetical protein VI056_15155 [Candidatus Limnocylindria bacterium]
MRRGAIVLSATVLVNCGGAASINSEPSRVIALDMSDFFFSPAVAEVRPGERITFALRNFGLYEHEFMAGREAVPGKGYAADWLAAGSADAASGHEMGHPGLGVRVAPNGTATVTVVVPADVGEFEFGCFIAGHYESGMKGKLVVVSNRGPVTPATGAPSKSGAPTPSATLHPMGSMGADDGEGH